MRAAVDTNVLAYAEGINGPGMQQTALDLIDRLPENEVVVPVQVLGELFNVLTRKASFPRDASRAIILSWQDTFAPVGTSLSALVAAADLAVDHRFVIWDAIIMATAAESGCRLLLSQDMHDGFTWRGVTIINPFAPTAHPLLARLLDGGSQ